MTCPKCGEELVEVDNPMRREVRHKGRVRCRGECGSGRGFHAPLNGCVEVKGHDGHHRYWDGRVIEAGGFA